MSFRIAACLAIRSATLFTRLACACPEVSLLRACQASSAFSPAVSFFGFAGFFDFALAFGLGAHLRW